MLERSTRDNNPPLYYLLLRGWTGLFGDSLLALRCFSALCFVLTIAAMYLFIHAAFRRHPHRHLLAWVVAALVALSIFQLRYAAEVRMYALGSTLAAFSSFTLWKALAVVRWRWWLAYGAFAVLFAYTHNYALFTLACQGTFVLGWVLIPHDWNGLAALRCRTLQRFLLTGALVFLAWSPWLPVLLRQRAQVQADYWTGPIGPWDLARLVYQAFVCADGEGRITERQALVAADLFVLAVLFLWRRAGPPEWYLLCCGLGPVLLSVLVTLLDTRIFCFRFLLFAHLFCVAGLAVVLCRIPCPLARSLAIGAVAVFFFGVAIRYQIILDPEHRPGARGAAEYIESQRRPGEKVIVCSALFYFPLLYHAGSAEGWHLYNDGRPVVHYFGAAALTDADYISADQIRRLGAGRVWVVNIFGGQWGDFIDPIPDHWVRCAAHTFREVRTLGNIEVIEYTCRPPVTRLE